MLNYFRHSWKKRGIVYSVKIVLSELWFDAKFGTETIKLKSLETMSDVSDADKVGATQYQATYVYNFKQFFGTISRKIDTNKSFIDMGSGKGRAMMLAALTGFKTVRGVEFSAQLCELAKNNLERFSAKFNGSINYEVIEANAKTYQFGSDVELVYMANPFGPEIIGHVIENIEKSLEKTPRAMLLVYFNPLHETMILSRGWREVAKSFDPAGQLLFKAFEKQ